MTTFNSHLFAFLSGAFLVATLWQSAISNANVPLTVLWGVLAVGFLILAVFTSFDD